MPVATQHEQWVCLTELGKRCKTRGSSCAVMLFQTQSEFWVEPEYQPSLHRLRQASSSGIYKRQLWHRYFMSRRV